MGGASFLFAVAAGACALTAADEVTLDERAIRLRDAASLECVPEERREEVGALVLAAPRAGRQRIALSGETVAALVRRRVPAIGVIEGDMGRTIAFHVPPRRSELERHCLRASRAIAAGEPITAADTSSAICETVAPAPVRYDRVNGVLSADAPLSEGAYLGPLLPGAGPATTEGAPMTVIVRAGPVTIERSVRAAQAGRAGDRLFVRAEDGAVFSVDYPASNPAP
ncbi:MAG TPA: hypothetical protein VEA80_00760 [Vitreimonas sp.]|uniref:hypothetical protein n=1 Tax=Vitreimonas sp. TaxID=3069702 RepID=UPI002D3B6035|nr:hypothetical protein [Vitreimonas sp.]HYD85981.1 hypothetical protein [Vitreimonas sp.]